MFVYNVTIKVDESIKDKWFSWLKEEHIPEVISTRCFDHVTILRLLEVDDSEGPTYTIQYHTASKALYNLYIEKFAGIMRQKSFDQWGNKFIAFRSIMQVMG